MEEPWKEHLDSVISRHKARMDALKARFPRMLNHQRFFDYSVGPGWEPIVEELLTRLEAQEEPTESEPQLDRIDQVKQKFGDLRVNFTFHRLSAEAKAWVAEAVERCSRTCQTCGKPGRKQSDRGDYAVWCDACFTARQNGINRDNWRDKACTTE